MNINYTNKSVFVPYNQILLDNIDKKNPLYMYVPLNKLTFSQSHVDDELRDNENIYSYSRRIKNHYLKTGKISFLNHKSPKAVYWKKTNCIQLLDNRRIVAVIKSFCSGCTKSEQLPDNIMVPIIIHHPETKLKKRLKKRYHPTICFKGKAYCNKIGKMNKPDTFGEAVTVRSISSYDNYYPLIITNRIPLIEHL